MNLHIHGEMTFDMGVMTMGKGEPVQQIGKIG